MIEVQSLTIRIRGRTLLDRVTTAAAPGEVTVVVGPNGAGKSTLLKAICGDLAPASGAVRLDGTPIAAMRAAELAARRAVLPQSSALAFPFTVYEVVRLGLRAGGRLGGSEERALVAEALARVDLAGFGGRFFQELSGGEQQRVHLARVLAQVREPVVDGRPRWLLLDEPTSSLDLRHQLSTLDVARDFAAAGGGVIAVLHDLNLAALYADRLVVVHRGTIAADGPPAAVITDEMMARVFGVRIRVGAPPPAGTAFVLPQTIGR
ncbi:heme ABC transporter ATP-binding protein [Prosthecomicrobium pneumaticum]|uniref:Iron complex transport system ATP-binding protein n=1 Tax=Prosthecomicrobium pneumaticum TaxID=81895 RepID=A0A7W9L1X1_9HYPH|nr:heme ABC transporter ATP-binding protein [Prosthecomicrobium pneumaticum]MBB5753095.1 iron complex transport system ATP-binding protein [Prosthecomicrobium pneumaticum]